MDRVLALLANGVTRFSLVLGRVALILMVGLVFVEVVARYVFNQPLGVGDEFAGYLLVAMVFLGLAYVAGKDAHIRVQVVTSRVSPRKNLYARCITILLFLVFSAVLTTLSYEFAMVNWVRDLRSSYIWRTPLWIPIAAMPVGFTLLSATLLVRFVSLLRKLRRGDQ